jgi:hypothetical protein
MAIDAVTAKSHNRFVFMLLSFTTNISNSALAHKLGAV